MYATQCVAYIPEQLQITRLQWMVVATERCCPELFATVMAGVW